jgi:hypothetical protein
MISTIHDTTIVNEGRKDRNTNVEIKKPYAVGQYNKFIKGIERADQHLSYYSVLKKTVKWLKKVVLYLLNCVLFNAYFVYGTLNTNKVKYKKFLHEVEGFGYQKSRNEVSQVLMTFSCHRRGPKQDPPGRLTGDFKIHKLEKTVGGGERKKKYPARQCRACAAHKRVLHISVCCT